MKKSVRGLSRQTLQITEHGWRPTRANAPSAIVLRKHLWLQKITLKCGRENVVVEHSRSLYVAITVLLNTKDSIDRERIVVVVDDATSHHLSGKTAPQSSEIPFAPQNV